MAKNLYSLKFYICYISIAAFSLSCVTAGASQTRITSPNKTYALSFTDDIEANQGLMFENRVIWFSLSKNDVVVLEKELFARDKAYKLPRFTDKYPRQEWKAENVLRLGEHNPLPDSSCNEIIVSNMTSDVITYFDVIILTPERFLIFDLHPGSSIKLYAQPESDLTNGTVIITGGKISGNQNIERKQATFHSQSGLSATTRYCITITDWGIAISSRDYEGVIYDTTQLGEALKKVDPEHFSPDDLPTPKEITIPKKDCGSGNTRF